jgi:hypothetical protein
MPRVSIFKPKAHLAITSMVKALKVLPNKSIKFETVRPIIKGKAIGDVITAWRQFFHLFR